MEAGRLSPLSPQLGERMQALRQLQFATLPAARTQMAAAAAEVLVMRAAVLERTVTLLERTKHGSLARATKARAEHLHTVAHGVEGKLKYVLRFAPMRLG
jgi:diphthamide biosynthesis protein 3